MIRTCLILMVTLGTTFDPSSSRYSAANAITFSKSGNIKDFVGSGFLVSHGGQSYAVTAKHVLFEAMDEGVNAVDVSKSVSRWQLRHFNKDTGRVTLGPLLNADANESLDVAVLSDDWLLFEVAANDSALTPLTLSDKPLKPGENITVHGCTYQTQTTCQQDVYSGQYVRSEGQNLLVKLNGVAPNTLRGLSGAPVLNAAGKVVGIVSNVLPDEANGGLFFAPFSVQPLMKFLSQT